MLRLGIILFQTVVATVAFKFLGSTTLGPDPQTVNRLNGESFQQDGVVTFNGEHVMYVLRLPSLKHRQDTSTLYSGRRRLRTPRFGTCLYLVVTSGTIPPGKHSAYKITTKRTTMEIGRAHV